jgi:hypothetical protein
MKSKNFLEDYLRNLLKLENVMEFQVKRKKIKPSPIESIIFSIIRNSEVLQRSLMKCTLSAEYLEIDGESMVSRSISDFPRLQPYTEVAFGPHLYDIKDVLSGFLTLSVLGWPYGASKRDNFSKLPIAQSLAILYLGGVPIGRTFPLGDDPITGTKEARTLEALIADPNKIVVFAIEGTRQSSGAPGKAFPGLERFVKRDIKKKETAFPGLTHSIVPMAISYDLVNERMYVTLGDPYKVDSAMENTNVTNEIFDRIKGLMKVTYSHAASTYLVNYVNSRNFLQDPLFGVEQEDIMYESLSLFFSENARGVNCEEYSERSRKRLFKGFIDFCKKKDIIYQRGTQWHLRLSKLTYTFERYEKQQIPGDPEALSLSRRNELTRDFQLEYPLQYMERMTRHITEGKIGISAHKI